jgi:hypothetical protein
MVGCSAERLWEVEEGAGDTLWKETAEVLEALRVELARLEG